MVGQAVGARDITPVVGKKQINYLTEQLNKGVPAFVKAVKAMTVQQVYNIRAALRELVRNGTLTGDLKTRAEAVLKALKGVAEKPVGKTAEEIADIKHLRDKIENSKDAIESLKAKLEAMKLDRVKDRLITANDKEELVQSGMFGIQGRARELQSLISEHESRVRMFERELAEKVGAVGTLNVELSNGRRTDTRTGSRDNADVGGTSQPGELGSGNAEQPRNKLISRAAEAVRGLFGKNGTDLFVHKKELGNYSSYGTVMLPSKDGKSLNFFVLTPDSLKDMKAGFEAVPVTQRVRALTSIASLHMNYDLEGGALGVNGAATGSFGARELQKTGSFEETEAANHTRMLGNTPRQTYGLLGEFLARAKDFTGNEKLEINWTRNETSAKPGKQGEGKFNAQTPDSTETITPEQRKQLRETLAARLGDKIKLSFGKVFGTEWKTDEHGNFILDAKGQKQKKKISCQSHPLRIR